MRNRFERSMAKKLPPGWPVRMELRTFGFGLMASTLWSFSCLVNIWQAHKRLYFKTPAGGLMLHTEMEIPRFETMLKGTLLGFWILVFVLMSFIVMHYLYYWRGAKSVYLMRRLPDKRLWHRQCVTVPFEMLLAVFFVSFLLIGLYNLIYRAAVLPEWVLN